MPNAKWLAQGTIYPDVIESAGAKTKKAHTIKSHHNVGGLPETLGLKLLEPLRELFKDEVRELGVELGLPHDMVYRHPFPGPGLGVRILGEVRQESPTCCAAPTRSSSTSCARRTGTTRRARPSPSSCRSERRRDGRRPHLRVRGGTARGADAGLHDRALGGAAATSLLGKVSNRIINEVRGINRVVYDISGKPPATIEWE
jgi:GMP synthase (glutamine-hydrolysing)